MQFEGRCANRNSTRGAFGSRSTGPIYSNNRQLFLPFRQRPLIAAIVRFVSITWSGITRSPVSVVSLNPTRGGGDPTQPLLHDKPTSIASILRRKRERETKRNYRNERKEKKVIDEEKKTIKIK